MEQIGMFDELKEIADQRPKWGNAPGMVYKGRIDDIRSRLPVFIRQPFALHLSAQSPQIINPYLDMIVRQPAQDDKRIIPVGTVSKKYTLVQHTRVFDMVVKALESGGIKTNSLDIELTITDCGERMGIGKKCHADCAIMQQVGDCVMPKRGVFAVVIEGGIVANGDIGAYRVR